MKVLIVDNYDSFTFNIAHYVEQFSDLCQVEFVDQINIGIIESFDKIILSPGPGLPSDRPELKQIIAHFYQSKPILGICLGHQALAEYFHATLFNMPQVHHGMARKTQIVNSDPIWNGLPETFLSGRYHSWAVDFKTIPKTLQVTSIDPENGTIMSFKHRQYDLTGIQFHPESILTEHGLKIIENWVTKV